MKTQSGNDRRFVLDSTAFLTMFEDEQGADTVQELLERAKREEIVAFVSFVTFTEILYITMRRKGEEEGLRRMAFDGIPSNNEDRVLKRARPNSWEAKSLS